MINDFDRFCAETVRIANGVENEISVGYPRQYRDLELKKTISNFNSQYPEVFLRLTTGTHEELYELLRTKNLIWS